MTDHAKRVALVVGNGKYRHTAALENPTNDAEAVAARLVELGFQLIGDRAQTDLDRNQLVGAFLDFGKIIRGAGIRLFYYAGHAAQYAGENYLFPIDARPQRERDIALVAPSATELLRFMEGATGDGNDSDQLNILIFDACRVNPFVERGSRAAESGLARIDIAPRGTIIGFATRPGAIAWDDGPGGHSPYTHALLDSLSVPGLDIYQFFNRAMTLVEDLTDGEQQPWVHFTSIRGPFSLHPGRAGGGEAILTTAVAADAVTASAPLAVDAPPIAAAPGNTALAIATPAGATVERRLSVILFADVVGYNHLMSGDEVGALHALKAHRQLIYPIFTAAGGRIAKASGHGFLIEFRSAFQAVQAALSAQRAIAEHNLHVVPERRRVLCMGIHLGDVIVEGDDIFGDGVNIAARLEEIAHPGGVALSEAVYAAVRNNIHATFEDAGPQTLKNIPTPVRVFNVIIHGDQFEKAPGHHRRMPAVMATRGFVLKIRHLIAGIGGAVVLALLAYVFGERLIHPPPAPTGFVAPPAAIFDVPIPFERGSVILSAAAKAIIEREAGFLKNNPNVRATIDGYAITGEGPSDTLQALAELRALSVRRQLTESGVDVSRLSILAHTDTRPRANPDATQPRAVVTRL